MTQLNAFVAHSFDPQDEGRIRPVLNFLDTFRDAGFLWQTAERAEVESVSQKVRRMIDEANVFVGFFTKRYPVISLEPTFADAWRVLRGRIRPYRWSAPAWVLQESGYALRAGKDLILLREPDVEVFGLQGDLEYIQFDPEKSSGVFSTLSEMINGLLAKAAGTTVRVTVEQGQKPAQEAVEPVTTQTQPEAPETGSSEPVFTVRLIEMWEASQAHNFEKIDEAWHKGADLIRAGRIKEVDVLAWDCLYFESRFEAGATDALDELRRLQKENPARPEAVRALARCFDGAKEFDTSSRLFLDAAELEEGDAKTRSLLGAARAFRALKQYDRAKEAASNALATAAGELREQAISLDYEVRKGAGEEYLAFATAEHALHANPQLPLRFRLGLDYRHKDLNEMALYHFKFLHAQNDKETGSLHNLALLYDDCKLPISAVTRYKESVTLGETLSAANLGFMYLNAGMAEEAKTLVDRAMQIKDHDPQVEKCLNTILEKSAEEKERETKLLEAATGNRGFLVHMGEALTATVPNVAGTWKFPFGEMTLTIASDTLQGTLDVSTTESGLAAVLSGIYGGGSPSVKTETYTFDGKMKGAVCEFVITISKKGSPESANALLAGPPTKSGFIVFEPDGRSAAYTELSGGKLSKIETLTKIA